MPFLLCKKGVDNAMAKAKNPKVTEQAESTIDTELVTFRFNRNVNVGGILVCAGACLDINLSDAVAFRVLNIGEVVKVGE